MDSALFLVIGLVVGALFGAWLGFWVGVVYVSRKMGRVIGETLRALKQKGKL